MEFKWLLFLYSLNFPKPGPAYCKKEFLVDFSPGSIPDLPLKPGQDMLRWSGMWKGKEGKHFEPGMTPDPIPFHVFQELPIFS